jgi:hypothetical protein
MLRGLFGLAAFAVLTAGLSAQAPKGDLLDQVKRQNEVVAQKMESEVRDALTEAQRLSGSDPARVVERLKKTLGLLEADRALTAARRDLLIRQIKDRLRVAEVEAERFARKAGEPSPKLASPENKTREAEQRAAEADKINRTLDYITQLQKEGRTAQASRAAEDLFRQYPNLAAPQVIGRTSTVLDQVAYLRGLKDEAANRRIAFQNSIDRAALAAGGDMEFPKNWHEIVSRPTRTTQTSLTTKEKQIYASLSKVLSVDYDKIGFMDVIEDISNRLGQPILLDKASLAEVGVSSETQVSLKIKGVTARTVLRKILGDVGLSYIVKDETIQVVSEKVARETMITKTYYLGTLLAGGPFSDAGIRFVPGLSQFEAMQNVLSVVQMIQNTVDPPSWSANGGKGTITFHAPSMSLIIRNTAEVHGMMSGYIR